MTDKDLTAPEAVGRLALTHALFEIVIDTSGYAHPMLAKTHAKTAATLRALSAALAAEKARAEAAEAERDGLKETLAYCENQWSKTDRETQAKMLDERDVRQKAEAKLKEAVKRLPRGDGEGGWTLSTGLLAEIRDEVYANEWDAPCAEVIEIIALSVEARILAASIGGKP